MELAVTIIAGVGILLFVVSYLAYILAGFKHHFVTGLIAALPVLNIVTLPALWYKAGKRFVIGFLGLALFTGSWFFGADKGLSNILSQLRGNNHPTTLAQKNQNGRSTSGSSLPNISSNTSFIESQFLDESDMEPLPKKALYIMAFKSVPISTISTLLFRVVRIQTTDAIFEGQLISTNDTSVVIQFGGSFSFEQEVLITNIRGLELMVKKKS